MDCKFLDSYRADLDGAALEVWYCRRGDPVVLGQTRAVAQRTCTACRQSDYGRSPGELIAEVDRRNQELAALTAIVSAANASYDLGAVLANGLEKTMEVLGLDAGWVALARDECLEVAVFRGVSAAYVEQIERLCADDDLVGIANAELETAVVEDLYAGPETLRFARQEGIENMMAVPLKAQDRLLGVLVVAARSPRVYTADDTYFAGAVGAQLSAAIENALLYREQLDRIGREHRLLEAVENVNSSLGKHAASMTILVEAAQLAGSAKSALLAVRGEALVAEEVYNLSDEFRRLFVLPLDDSVSGAAIRAGETVAVDDVDDEVLVDPYLVAEGGYRAFLTAPLQSYKGTYGALSVFFDEPRTFSDDDRTILRTFAGQAAVALDNERLLREREVLARTDGLTGVHNRAYLELMLERTAHDLHRNGGTASLLFVDVDDLKGINDRDGHETGDRILRDLAGLLVECCRETDTVARFGGDEFVVLMPEADAEGARLVRTKVEKAMAAYDTGRDGETPLSASLGVHTAAWPEAQHLLREADRRMYETKRRRAGG